MGAAQILVAETLVIDRALTIAIQPVKRDLFEDRFANWVRWCLRDDVHYEHVGSAEGHWRSPQVWDPPGPRPIEIDEPDAIRVNRAYVYLRTKAPQAAAVIKIIRFTRGRPQWKAQQLGIHHTQLEAEYDRSKKMLANVLKLQDSKGRMKNLRA